MRLAALAALLPVAALLPGAARADAAAGTVSVRGVTPAASMLKVTRDQGACGAEVPDDSLLVGAGGALSGAVVVARTSAPPDAPANSELVIEQKGCRFLPRISAITVGTKVGLVNADGILHNSRATQGTRTAFNFAFPMRNLKRETLAAQPGVLDIRCDAGHTWMRALVHVLPHRWFAVTDGAGAFRIEGLPADATALEIRHERLPEPLVVPLGPKHGALRIEIDSRSLRP
jgi:plastocyanin